MRRRGTSGSLSSQRAPYHLCHQNGRYRGARQKDGLGLRKIHALRQYHHVDQNLELPLLICPNLPLIVFLVDVGSGQLVPNRGHHKISRNPGLVKEFRQRNCLYHIHRKNKGLPVFVLIFLIRIYNQFVSRRALRNRFGQLLGKCIEMLNLLQIIKA